ncbi:MAG: LamG-like jellyroll fold domain-containing protein [Mesonia sp.]|uniref:LamG-like jellyroll fold domain-containing protein n=1 Tax=Mesonia sp. TaxID=1960830 RepID=UPI003241D417
MFNKNIARKISWLAVVAIFATACQQEEIDDISRVDPGPDEASPVVEISAPDNGVTLETETETISIPIEFSASDDIRLNDVSVMMDGVEIASYDSFTDYRIFQDELTYDNLGDGEHTVSVTATDAVGNSTTEMISFTKTTQIPYDPEFDGEVFYMTFNGNYDEFVDERDVTVVGTPGYAGEAEIGSNAYAGDTDSYLTVPMDGITPQNFSATFWYKVNATPDRAGILTVGPEDTDNPDSQNIRTSGFRLFREASGTSQRIKLNVGTGNGESWNDGGLIDPAAGEWVFIAFTISDTETKIYIDGVEVNTGSMGGSISWEGTSFISIMSGAPRFTGWGHLADSSYMDDLRLYDKALSSTEVADVMAYTGE